MSVAETVRAIVLAVVGGFLVVYAAVSAVPNRAVIAVVGLVLLGVVSVGPVLGRRDADH
jgi:hypothetical protein